jgi:hypothetical protein
MKKIILWMLVVLACVLGVFMVSSCGSPNWYNNGKAYSIAHGKIDTASLVGVSPDTWCANNLSQMGGGGTDGTGTPLNGPSDITGNDAAQWVQGCADGYNVSNPGG